MPSEKRELITYVHGQHRMSIRQVCKDFSIQQSVFYYQSKPSEDNQVREKLSELANLYTRRGFWMMHHHLRLMDHHWNHKKVYRIYTEMKLNMRRKHKKRFSLRVKEPLLQPLHPNVTSSMDFMHDGLINGKPFRSFNVIDDYNRKAFNITLDKSFTSAKVIRELEKRIE